MKKKNLTKEAKELLADLDDAFLDHTLDEFTNLEEAIELIDRARGFLTDYLNTKATP